jgi:predicted nuclease with TOPRIM domain
MASVSSGTDSVTNGAAAAAPVWGRSLERVLSAFDTEATRLQDLRGKLQELGGEMAQREQRVTELETELQRVRVERLRDQEAVDRLKHELADRNSRLERALQKTQELVAIIQGGHLQ